MKATQLLKKDHATVKQLFRRFGKTSDRAKKTRDQLVDRIAMELEIHAQIEEEIFYPAMAEVRKAAVLVKEAREEHEEVKALVSDMQSAGDAEALTAKVDELKDAVLHHATEEERQMFPLAEELGRERLTELGEELHDRKQALKNAMMSKVKRGVKKVIVRWPEPARRRHLRPGSGAAGRVSATVGIPNTFIVLRNPRGHDLRKSGARAAWSRPCKAFRSGPHAYNQARHGRRAPPGRHDFSRRLGRRKETRGDARHHRRAREPGRAKDTAGHSTPRHRP